MVVEAVIAAPLWAIMHVHPDGEGLTGRGGNGYALVLTVVLRPALMVFGLVAAIALMYPFGAILNEVFPSVFNMSVGSSDTTSVGGVLTKVAGAFIYVGIMMTLVSKIFSLIHVLPDQILRWIGGSQDYFGRGMEQEATGGAKQAVASVSGAAQQGYATHRISGREGDAGEQQVAAIRREAITKEFIAANPGAKNHVVNNAVNERLKEFDPPQTAQREAPNQTGGTSGQQSGSSAQPSGQPSAPAPAQSKDAPDQEHRNEPTKGGGAERVKPRQKRKSRSLKRLFFIGRGISGTSVRRSSGWNG